MFSNTQRQGYFLIFLCGCSSLVGFTVAKEETDPDTNQEPEYDFGFDDFKDPFKDDPFFNDDLEFDYNDTYLWNATMYPPYEAENPGLRARVTQKALDYATTLAIDILMSQINFLSIPDIQQTIGSIDVQVTQVKIVQFERPNAEFIPHPGSGISLKISKLNVKVSALYEAQMGLGFFGTIEKEGTLSVETEDLSLSVKLHFDKHPWTGLPSRLTPICESSGELIITFKGGWADMLNVGSSVFATTIRSLIASQVCSAAQTEIDKNLNSDDGTLLLNQTIMGLFDFHFTMTEFPVFNEHYVESSHIGRTYYIPQWSEPPFSPSPMPAFENHTDRMFYAYISDYVLNSAFHAGYLSGLLNYNITKQLLPVGLIPPQFREIFSTSCDSPMMCLGVIYPGLAKHYPGEEVSINVYATEAPNVTFYDGHSIRAKTSANLEFYVESYGQKYPAFGLGFSLSIDVSLVVKKKKIAFRLNDLSPSVEILYSNVDDVGTSFFYETIIRSGIRAALPFIEEIGEKGYDIPQYLNLKIENSEIIVIEEPGIFVVATDLLIMIPQNLNLIAMLGPNNDTSPTQSSVTTEQEDQTSELSSPTPPPTTTPKRSRPKQNKRRRGKGRRRRRTTPVATTTLPTVSLEVTGDAPGLIVDEEAEGARAGGENNGNPKAPKRQRPKQRRRKRPRQRGSQGETE